MSRKTGGWPVVALIVLVILLVTASTILFVNAAANTDGSSLSYRQTLAAAAPNRLSSYPAPYPAPSRHPTEGFQPPD
jgi:hypothetical protein